MIKKKKATHKKATKQHQQTTSIIKKKTKQKSWQDKNKCGMENTTVIIKLF